MVEIGQSYFFSNIKSDFNCFWKEINNIPYWTKHFLRRYIIFIRDYSSNATAVQRVFSVSCLSMYLHHIQVGQKLQKISNNLHKKNSNRETTQGVQSFKLLYLLGLICINVKLLFYYCNAHWAFCPRVEMGNRNNIYYYYY